MFKPYFNSSNSSVVRVTLDKLFYDQIDRVAMGSLLGHALANLFMGYYEILWLNKFRECEIILNRQYVDDIMSF